MQQCQAANAGPHSGSQDNDDAEHRATRRDQLRKAQKIQKKIIMEGLEPLMLVAEDRVVYTDPDDPESISVVLRRNVNYRYNDSISHSDKVLGKLCWLADALNGNQPLNPDSEDSIGELPFDSIEIHTGNNAMPGWLSQLFFDSTM
ncbi:hypothetical protein EV175_007720, partial [Coemansia sp. RSA 1933]